MKLIQLIQLIALTLITITPALADEPISRTELVETLERIERVGTLMAERIADELDRQFVIHRRPDDEPKEPEIERVMFAAIGWHDEYLVEPEFSRFPQVEFVATVHPTTTARRFGPGLPFAHHLAPTLDWVQQRTWYIADDYAGWIYVDAEPWRSKELDGSTYQWVWAEMHEYYRTLLGHFRVLYPDAKLVIHHLVGAPIHFADGEKNDLAMFIPIAELVDAISVSGYSSNASHATSGGLGHLRNRLDRAEELAEMTGHTKIICIHSRRIAGDHADHPDAVDGQLYWTDDALRMRRDEVRERGYEIMLWSGRVDETTLHALGVLAEDSR
jgi:hypothetical protein